MHFIAVHDRTDPRSKEVIYLNPNHISLIRTSENGAEITFSNGKSVLTWENPDDLIVKIQGFTKPKTGPAEAPERHILSEAS
jgi:hypothetical protein